MALKTLRVDPEWLPFDVGLPSEALVWTFASTSLGHGLVSMAIFYKFEHDQFVIVLFLTLKKRLVSQHECSRIAMLSSLKPRTLLCGNCLSITVTTA